MTKEVSPSPPNKVCDLGSYSAIKRRVHELKSIKHRAKNDVQRSNESESVALLEQKASFELRIIELEDEVESLKHLAKAGNERSQKMRAGYDRDKRSLKAQVDKLSKALETKDAEEAQRVKKIEAAHFAVIQEMQRQLDNVVQDKITDRLAYERARDEAVNEIDDWCRGEIDAVRLQASGHIDLAKAESQDWKIKLDEANAKYNDLQMSNCDTLVQVKELEGDLARRLGELTTADAAARALSVGFETERAEWKTKLDTSNALRAEEVQSVKAAHRSQLELVDARLQQVVAKKDSAILSLKKELSEVTGRLRRFEALVGEGEGGRERGEHPVYQDALRVTDPRLRKSTGGGLLPSTVGGVNRSESVARGLSARN